MKNTKTKMIDIFDTFERNFLKWNAIFWFILLFIIVLLISINSEELEVIDKVHSYKEVVLNPVDNVEDRAFNLIIKYEWFHDKPYFDYKQWSCWYGMRCSKDTKNITREKSKVFVMERIKHIRERHNLYSIDDWIEVALISFTYNLWTPPEWYKWYLKHWYINGLKNRMREYSYAGGKFMRGLYKRRMDESSFLN